MQKGDNEPLERASVETKMVVRTRLTRLPNKDAFENERVATWKAIYVQEARGRVIHVIYHRI